MIAGGRKREGGTREGKREGEEHSASVRERYK